MGFFNKDWFFNGRRPESTRSSSNKAATKQQQSSKNSSKNSTQEGQNTRSNSNKATKAAKAAAKATRTARKTAHNKKSQHQVAAKTGKKSTKSNKSSTNILEGQKRQGCVFHTTTAARRPECGERGKPRTIKAKRCVTPKGGGEEGEERRSVFPWKFGGIRANFVSIGCKKLLVTF